MRAAVRGGRGPWPAAGVAALGLGLVVAAGSGAPALVPLLAGVSGSALLLRQVARHPVHPLRTAWLLTALVLGLMGARSLFTMLLWSGGLAAAAAILSHLAATLVLGLALVARIGGPTRRELRLAALLDAFTAALVTAALALMAVPAEYGSLDGARLLAAGLPLAAGAGLLVLALHAAFLRPSTWRRVSLLLVLATVLVGLRNMLAAMSVLGFAAIPIGLHAGVATGALLLLLAAALLERSTSDGDLAVIERAPPTLLLLLPYGLLGLVAVVMGGDPMTGREQSAAAELVDVLVGSAFLVVLARQWLLLRTTGSLLGRLRAAHQALQSAHQALAAARAEAAREARTDATTGLPNKRQLLEYLETLLAQHRRTAQPLALVFADIDFFKSVNDRFGHDAGDAALRQVGQCLRLAVRDGDIAARFGGEEFVLLLPSSDEVEALSVAERLRLAVRALSIPLPDGQTTAVTISLGVAACPAHGSTAEELLRSADQALYAAKGGGRDCVRLAGVPAADLVLTAG